MPSIWTACDGDAAVTAIAGSLCRMVESQEQVATTALVDDLQKQGLLEEMLEASKPPRLPGTEHLDYILATPFRYPPLRHGSRFGRAEEPGVFYGSLAIPPMLAEKAYYSLVFWDGMVEPPPDAYRLQKSVFWVGYATAAGVRLQEPPFSAYRETLRNPAEYGETQLLGGAMRAAGVAAAEYESARDPQGGLNVALFEPTALAERHPRDRTTWLVWVDGERVQFACAEQPSAHYDYPRSLFLVNDVLPAPAP